MGVLPGTEYTVVSVDSATGKVTLKEVTLEEDTGLLLQGVELLSRGHEAIPRVFAADRETQLVKGDPDKPNVYYDGEAVEHLDQGKPCAVHFISSDGTVILSQAGPQFPGIPPAHIQVWDSAQSEI